MNRATIKALPSVAPVGRHVLGAEQHVVGALLISDATGEHWREVAESGIEPAHFASGDLATIFEHMRSIAGADQCVDIETVAASLVRSGDLDRVGGYGFLAELAAAVPSLSNLATHARVCVEAAQDRQLKALAGSDLPFGEKAGAIEEFLRGANDGGGDLRSLLINPVDWRNTEIPAREWVVPDLIPIGSITGLGGPGGVAKSTLAQQLATSLATGNAFLGIDLAPARALYITCEDDSEELHRRQDRMNAALGLQYQDLTNLRLVSAVGRDLQIIQVVDGVLRRTPRFRQLCRLIEEFRPRVVFLDLVPDFWNGNEIMRGQVNAFVKTHLGYIAREYGVAVVCLYHPSKAGQADGTGTSGSTAWEGSFRSRLYLSRVDEEVRKLSLMKANYAAPREFYLRYVDGVLVPTECEAEPSHGGLGGNQATALDALHQLHREHIENLTAGGAEIEGAKVLIADWKRRCKEQGISKASLTSIPKSLHARGLIALTDLYAWPI